MAVLYGTPTIWNYLHTNVVLCTIYKATQSDWVSFKSFKGVIPLMGMVKAATSGASTSEATWTYGVATFAATTATATTTTVTSATIARGNTSSSFYVQLPAQTAGTPGEIVEVVTDSAPTASSATWTLKRGCLGTTAQAIAAGDVGAIMNVVFVGTAGVGTEIIAVIPLPDENSAAVFAPTKTSV